jgi:DNA-binding response OmpR family regulator
MTRHPVAIDPAKVLLAEDDPALRELLVLKLFGAGYAVSSCSNGLELLEKLDPSLGASERFDLVVTDLRMPALAGLEVLEALHDLPRRPPFICMTAFGDAETHATARRLGAALTLDKPFDLDELVALAEIYCRQGRDNS